MIKRYDYHRVDEQFKLIFIVWVGLILIYLAIFSNRKLPPLSDLFFMIVFLCIGIGVSVVTHVKLKRTFVEVREDGIYFNGWRKKIFSPWHGIQEIKILGRKHKIYTTNGNFSIGYLEPAESEQKRWRDLIRKERAKYSKELIEEIKKQSPNAKLTYSIFLRPL